MPMNVLVTGASGFIGSALTAALLQQGNRVKVLSRQASSLQAFEWRGGVEHCLGDLRRPRELAHCCQSVQAVIHCAGYAHNSRDSELHEQVNFQGTANLLEAAVAAGVERFVFLGSSKAASRFMGPYGKAKLAAENLLLAADREGRIKACSLRPSAVYGPGMKGNLASWMRLLRKGWAPRIPPTGTRIDMIGRQDLVRAIIAALKSETVWGKPWFLADGHPYRINDIEKAIRLALGKAPAGLSVPKPIFGLAAMLGETGAKLAGVNIGFNRSGYNTLFFDEFLGDTGFFLATGMRPAQNFFEELPAILDGLEN